MQVGTALLCTPEATTGAAHRAALLSPRAARTTLTNVFSGRPARGIVNRAVRELGPMSRLAPAFPLASLALAPLRAAAEAQDRDDFTPLWCGQNVTSLSTAPAAEVLRDLLRAWRVS